ncbi:MAG TPA: glucoamylase family protein [Gemmatimonadales bacterium]|nr:glucoamylase family protein [Gemmatimonadales bacterium]
MTRRTQLAAALVATAAAACGLNHSEGPPPPPPPPLDPAATAAFLDTVQERTFHYFWDLTNPANGLTPDRSPTPSFSSIAAVGFALTAYPIGVERSYITRPQAAQRVVTTLRFFWTAPQDSAATGSTGYHGFFYHFLDMNTGARFQQVELSTIDTALLLAGILTCQSYFDGTDTVETEIRGLADSIYRRTDWQWAAPRPPVVSLGWHPESGFLGYDWRGYNEAMILYILALGSPTHPVDSAAWSQWTAPYQWGTFYGQTHLGFAPLFGHHYSHVWIDFRGIQDAYMKAHGIDYFENSRRATYAQRAYAYHNPGGWRGYSDRIWGLTASDGPGDVTLTIDGRARQFHGYWARGASFTEIPDDGTIAPTAAGGSIPFAPEIAIPALVAMRQTYGDSLFTTYGFRDALNPTFTQTSPAGWFDVDYLGIDQGPILAMAENYRTELIWRIMRGNPYFVRGLCRAGFTGGWLAGKCP